MLDPANLLQTITVQQQEVKKTQCWYHFACFKYKEMDKSVFRRKIKKVRCHMVTSCLFISILPLSTLFRLFVLTKSRIGDI